MEIHSNERWKLGYFTKTWCLEMSDLQYRKKLVSNLIDYKMRPLDKYFLMIPDEKLNFKPTEDAMTVAELGIHIYQCVLVNASVIEKGDFTKEDLNELGLDQKKISSTKEIVEYGEKIKAYMRKVLEKITEEDLETEVTYTCWGGFKANVGFALEVIIEETVHHRGQLCVYLRMLGLTPSSIYDYS